jgi:hypothetical protein
MSDRTARLAMRAAKSAGSTGTGAGAALPSPPPPPVLRATPKPSYRTRASTAAATAATAAATDAAPVIRTLSRRIKVKAFQPSGTRVATDNKYASTIRDKSKKAVSLESNTEGEEAAPAPRASRGRRSSPAAAAEAPAAAAAETPPPPASRDRRSSPAAAAEAPAAAAAETPPPPASRGRRSSPAAAATVAAEVEAEAAPAPVDEETKLAIFVSRKEFYKYVASRLATGKKGEELLALLMICDSYHDFKGPRAQENELIIKGKKTSYCFDALSAIFKSIFNGSGPGGFAKSPPRESPASPTTSPEHKYVQNALKLYYDISWSDFEQNVRRFLEKDGLRNTFHSSPGIGTAPTEISYSDFVKETPYASNVLLLNEDDDFKRSPAKDRYKNNAEIGRRLIKWFFEERKKDGSPKNVDKDKVKNIKNFEVGFSFDARTSVIKDLLKPLNDLNNIHAFQYITPQNFLDSANTNMEVMSFNNSNNFAASDKSRNKFMPSLDKEFNNFFTKDKADFTINTTDFATNENAYVWNSKIGSKNVELQVLFKDRANKDKHRNGPSVKFLSNLLIRCTKEEDNAKRGKCFSAVAGLDKNYTMVDPSPVLNKFTDEQEMNKIIFDLKRFGDHEQANAVLYLNMKGNPTVFVTGDILSGVYSRIIGNPTIYVNPTKGGDEDDEEEDDVEGGERSMFCYRGIEFDSDPLAAAQSNVSSMLDSINYIFTIYTQLSSLQKDSKNLDILKENIESRYEDFEFTDLSEEETQKLQKIFFDLKIKNALAFLKRMQTSFKGIYKTLRDGIHAIYIDETLNKPVEGAAAADIRQYTKEELREILEEKNDTTDIDVAFEDDSKNPPMKKRTHSKSELIKIGVNINVSDFKSAEGANRYAESLKPKYEAMSAKLQEANNYVQYLGLAKTTIKGKAVFAVPPQFFDDDMMLASNTCSILQFNLSLINDSVKRAYKFDTEDLGRNMQKYKDLNGAVMAFVEPFVKSLFNLSDTISKERFAEIMGSAAAGTDYAKVLEENMPTSDFIMAQIKERFSAKKADEKYITILAEIFNPQIEILNDLLRTGTEGGGMRGGGQMELFADPNKSPLAEVFSEAVKIALFVAESVREMQLKDPDNAPMVEIVKMEGFIDPTFNRPLPIEPVNSLPLVSKEPVAPEDAKPQGTIKELPSNFYKPLNLSAIVPPKKPKALVRVPNVFTPPTVITKPYYGDEALTNEEIAEATAAQGLSKMQPLIRAFGGAYKLQSVSGADVFMSDYDDLHQLDLVEETVNNVRGFYAVYGELDNITTEPLTSESTSAAEEAAEALETAAALRRQAAAAAEEAAAAALPSLEAAAAEEAGAAAEEAGAAAEEAAGAAAVEAAGAAAVEAAGADASYTFDVYSAGEKEAMDKAAKLLPAGTDAATIEAEKQKARLEYLKGEPKTTSVFMARQMIALQNQLEQNGCPDLTEGGYDIRMTKWWSEFLVTPFTIGVALVMTGQDKYDEIIRRKDENGLANGIPTATRDDYIKQHFNVNNTFYYAKLAINERVRIIRKKMNALNSLYFTASNGKAKIKLNTENDSSEASIAARKTIKREMFLIKHILQEITLYDSFVTPFNDKPLYTKYTNVRNKIISRIGTESTDDSIMKLIKEIREDRPLGANAASKVINLYFTEKFNKIFEKIKKFTWFTVKPLSGKPVSEEADQDGEVVPPGAEAAAAAPTAGGRRRTHKIARSQRRKTRKRRA